MAEGQTSINIPQILAVALVGFFAIRWLLNKPSTTTSASRPSSSSRNRGVDPAKVEQVSAMFPQLDRRAIAWDLQQNGGSVAATTERVLGGRGLDNPPPTYQPALPAAPSSAASGSARAATRGGSASQSDLITKYGLQTRVGGKGKEPVPSASEEQRRNAWSADKAARAEGLKRRREEMILAARRRMEAKEADL